MKSCDELKELVATVLKASFLGVWLAATLMTVVVFGGVAVKGGEDGDSWVVFYGICFALVSVANGWLVFRRWWRS